MAQNITPYGLQAQGQKKDDEWEKYLNQAKLAMAMDGETALGLALGKAIRYFWDKHLAERNEKQDRQQKELDKNGTPVVNAEGVAVNKKYGTTPDVDPKYKPEYGGAVNMTGQYVTDSGTAPLPVSYDSARYTHMGNVMNDPTLSALSGDELRKALMWR